MTRPTHFNPSRRDHYADVTSKAIAALEAGTPPWRQPWTARKAGLPMPRNAATGARYRGINLIVLGMSAVALGDGDPRWATYRQAAERGWQVRKGERGTTAFFFKRLEVPDADAAEEDATRRIPMLRAFSLFHVSQIDSVPDYQPPSLAQGPWQAPDAVETIIANSGADIRVGGDRAFYSPSTDHIQMPPRDAFASAAGWSSTIVHEAGHWSGAESRLNRKLKSPFGSDDYAREELRAEIAQAMVCSELNVACEFDNTASYLGHWLEALRSDRKEIFRAAADAQRIADYLLAFHPGYGSASVRDDDATGAAEPAGDAGDDRLAAAA